MFSPNSYKKKFEELVKLPPPLLRSGAYWKPLKHAEAVTKILDKIIVPELMNVHWAYDHMYATSNNYLELVACKCFPSLRSWDHKTIRHGIAILCSNSRRKRTRVYLAVLDPNDPNNAIVTALYMGNRRTLNLDLEDQVKSINKWLKEAVRGHLRCFQQWEREVMGWKEFSALLEKCRDKCLLSRDDLNDMNHWFFMFQCQHETDPSIAQALFQINSEIRGHTPFKQLDQSLQVSMLLGQGGIVKNSPVEARVRREVE